MSAAPAWYASITRPERAPPAACPPTAMTDPIPTPCSSE